MPEVEKKTGERIVAATRWVEDQQSSGRGERSGLPRPTSNPSFARAGIVVKIGNPDERFVHVVEPRFNDSDPWDGGEIIPAEPSEEVRCWSPLRAEVFTDFVLEGGPPDPDGDPMEVTDDMNVCPILKIRGVWRILPIPFHGYSKFPEGAPFHDCWAMGGTP